MMDGPLRPSCIARRCMAWVGHLSAPMASSLSWICLSQLAAHELLPAGSARIQLPACVLLPAASPRSIPAGALDQRLLALAAYPVLHRPAHLCTFEENIIHLR